MGVNSLPKTVTQQHRGCDLNPGPTVHEPSTLTTRLLSQPTIRQESHESRHVRETVQVFNTERVPESMP